MSDMSNIDLNNLSDDELKNLDLAALESELSKTSEDVDEPSTTQPDTQNNADTSDGQSDTTDESDESDDSDEPDDDNNTEGDTTTEDTATHDDDQNTQQSSEAVSDGEVDYKAFYEVMTKPFRANGREIQVSNPDDMIALMQQGANYSKKMAQLKPNLATMRLLEQRGLTDKQKLGYLLDLYDKKPEAIAKLVKDANIDLYSFDTDQAEGYKPQEVNEPSEVESVINELYEGSENFGVVMNDITKLWDSQSKQMVADKPEVLYALAHHAQSGLYQQINDAIDYERMLGRMVHTPYLEAYAQIEARILQANQQQQAPQEFTAPRPTQSQPQASPANDKKRKAMTPKSNGNTQVNDFDPLKMSDADFLKFYEQQQFH